MDCSLPGSSVIGFPKQKHWSGLLFLSPGDLPNPGIKPGSLTSACIGRQVLYYWHHLGSSVHFFVQDPSVLPMAPAFQHPPPLLPTEPFLSSDFLHVLGCVLLFLLHFCIMYTKPDLCWQWFSFLASILVRSGSFLAMIIWLLRSWNNPCWLYI